MAIDSNILTDHKTLSQLLFDNGNGFNLTYAPSLATVTRTPVILIKNPSNSGILVQFDDLILSIVGGAAAIDYTTWQIWVNPTITANGTPLTPNKVNPSQLQNSILQIFSSPTIAANGINIQSIRMGVGQTFLRKFDLKTYLPPNFNFLITQWNSVATLMPSTIFGNWIETPLPA